MVTLQSGVHCLSLAWLMVFGLPAGTTAQNLQRDLTVLLKKIPASTTFNIKNEPPPTPINRRQISETQLLFSGLLYTYQSLVSAQDVSTCNFVPSCSRFSQAALERAGMVRGLLLTSDRLLRCNGLPGIGSHYELAPELGKFADPIENYARSSVPETGDAKN